MENKPNRSNLKKNKAGRKPVQDPAIHKYYVYLNSADSVKLENMFDLSGYKYKAHFIRDKVLNASFKVKIFDKSTADYIIKLSQFRGQMRGIANNYNQLIRLLKEQLGEKKALAFLYKLEKATIALVQTHKQIESQIQQLEERWLQ